MNKRTWLAALVLTASLLGLSGAARAGVLDACGNVTLPLSAQCEVVPPGIDCQANCTPINMEVSCARELYEECGNVCTVKVVEEEVTVCSQSCVTDCNLNPGSFSCTGSCGGKCSADCSGNCSASANQSQCLASCQASCSGYCEGQCNVVLPSMSCEQKCQQTCRGVVQAKLNMDCQLQCQTKERYSNCETRLTGGCTGSCQTSEGALFCEVNGRKQYINFASSLQACVDALKNMQIGVDWHVSVSMSGCQMAGGAAGGGLLLLLGLIPLALRRRRWR